MIRPRVSGIFPPLPFQQFPFAEAEARVGKFNETQTKEAERLLEFASHAHSRSRAWGAMAPD